MPRLQPQPDDAADDSAESDWADPVPVSAEAEMEAPELDEMTLRDLDGSACVGLDPAAGGLTRDIPPAAA